MRHLQRSAEGFEATRGLFLEQSLHEASSWTLARTAQHLRAAWRGRRALPLTRTLSGWNARAGHPKLQQLFNRYATYNGSDPYRAPAMLHVIPHLEFGMGTFAPEGGMHAIVEALHQTALNLGVRVHTDTPVSRHPYNSRSGEWRAHLPMARSAPQMWWCRVPMSHRPIANSCLTSGRQSAFSPPNPRLQG